MATWYAFGTCSVTNGTANVSFSVGTTLLANAKASDGLLLNGQLVEILSITDNTHLVLRNNWSGSTVTNGAYAIVPGPNWSDRTALALDVSTYLAAVSGVTSSADTLTIANTGSVTLKIPHNMRLAVGARVRLADTANPATRYMEGVVTSYIGASLTVLLDTSAGSGVGSSWNVNHAGDRGVQGPQGPQGPGREKLVSNLTYYVRADGNDANTGLVDSAGGALLTLQAAWNKAATYDFGGNSLVIQVRDGTFPAGLTAGSRLSNCANVFLWGNLATPANCVVSATSAPGFLIRDNKNVSIDGFKIQTATGGNAIEAGYNSVVFLGNLNFGACAGDHIRADGGTIIHTAAYTVSGNATLNHHHCIGWGSIGAPVAVTITGTPSMTRWCGVANGLVDYSGASFTGAITGAQYYVHYCGTLRLSGVTLPGSGANMIGGNLDDNFSAETLDANTSARAPIVYLNNDRVVANGGFIRYDFDGHIKVSARTGFEVRVVNGNLAPHVDNSLSTGTAANRWAVVYAATGTINTSDNRAKQQIRTLTDAERAVAHRIRSQIRAFKFNDAVGEKGDAARVHFGVIAQEVGEAFRAEGLDPERYALFCHDAWNEQPEVIDPDGNIVSEYRPAGDRYGIRYEQLMAFILGGL